MAEKPKKYVGHQNVPLFVSMVERARSSAAGVHGAQVNPKAQLKSKRENTRLARTRSAINDQL